MREEQHDHSEDNTEDQGDRDQDCSLHQLRHPDREVHVLPWRLHDNGQDQGDGDEERALHPEGHCH